MSVIPENPLFPNPVLPKTSVLYFFVITTIRITKATIFRHPTQFRRQGRMKSKTICHFFMLLLHHFQTDWNDGLSAASLAKAKGAPVPGYRDLDSSPHKWVSNLDSALNGARRIGVHPVMDARDMASPNVEYLGVMAWAAQFQWIKDRTAPGDKIEVSCGSSKARVGEECHFKLDMLEKVGIR